MQKCLALVVCVSALVGCAAAREPSTPREALSDYADALRAGRTRDAYALLSAEAKKSMSFDAFERMVKENREETLAIAEALTRPSNPAAITATVTAPDGQVLLLRFEDGAWHMDRSAIDLYAQDTPEAAISSFIRAFEHKRWDVLLRFVPDDKKEGLDEQKLKAAFEGEQREEVERLTQALKTALPTAKLELLGERATMSYGAAGTVELVRQHGAWKIEEF